MKQTQQSKVKPKKPTKSVKNSQEEDFDVQYWSDREVNELVSSYASKQFTEKDFYD